jgi:pimeloyl-ACP methyl ester carboxylesterase
VFAQSEGQTCAPLLFTALRQICDEWDVHFVEKRGVSFGDCEPEGGAEGAGAEYVQGASYEGRVSDVCRVLDALLPGRHATTLPVVVIGSSEGSDIAVGVAARHHAPTHVALLPFSAGHGLHDCLVSLRRELAEGTLTAAEFREQYDWLVETFQNVLGPAGDATDRFLWGHSYRRWRSHCSGAVLQDLLGVEIPIFLGIPSLDLCDGADLVVSEFVKHGKRNLTYRNYVGYDHGFFETVGGRAQCRHEQVLNDILEWVGPDRK